MVFTLTQMDTTRKTGAFLVSADKRILFLMEPIGLMKWSLPKGSVKTNESYLEGARREVLEETGINIDKIEPRGKIKIDKFHFFIFDLPYHSDYYCEYINDVDINKIYIKDKSPMYLWLSPEIDMFIFHIMLLHANLPLRRFVNNYTSKYRNILFPTIAIKWEFIKPVTKKQTQKFDKGRIQNY